LRSSRISTRLPDRSRSVMRRMVMRFMAEGRAMHCPAPGGTGKHADMAAAAMASAGAIARHSGRACRCLRTCPSARSHSRNARPSAGCELGCQASPGARQPSEVETHPTETVRRRAKCQRSRTQKRNRHYRTRKRGTRRRQAAAQTSRSRRIRAHTAGRARALPDNRRKPARSADGRLGRRAIRSSTYAYVVAARRVVLDEPKHRQRGTTLQRARSERRGPSDPCAKGCRCAARFRPNRARLMKRTPPARGSGLAARYFAATTRTISRHLFE
jgi:hypothetical protein